MARKKEPDKTEKTDNMNKPAKPVKLVPLTADDGAYRNTWNPLRYLTEQQIEMMLDAARSGRISQLQVLYDLVEASDLTLAMCINRRQSALPDWTVKRRDTRRYRSYDEKLAQEQEAFLTGQFVQCEDSGTLLKAIDTLHMAVFRGLGVIEPIYDEFGLVKIISLDPWNFAIDFSRHNELGQHPLYWNPSGSDLINFTTELEQIPEEQVVANFNPAPIDSFGLQIFLATHMGFESYAKLIARKGLPATYVVAPEDLPSDQLDTWARKAVDCARGGSGAFPYGSNIITQAIDPSNGQSIQSFLEYMSKQIVLASTGGTLTSLAQPTGMGSNVADVQQDVFKTIVRHDAYKIGDLINRGIAKKLLDWQFPGKPHLVYFDLSNEDKQNPEKYLADAVQAKNAGLAMDINQLEELTGYKLTKEEAPQDTSIWNVPRMLNSTNKADTWEPMKAARPQEATERPSERVSGPEVVENTEEGLEAPEKSPDAIRHGKEILRAFDHMLDPLRILFEQLLHASTKEESDSIVAEINQLIESLEVNDDHGLTQAVEALLSDNFKDTDERN